MKRTSIGTVMCLLALQAGFAATASESPGHTLYDDDPDHLWNRIHVTLMGRKGADGTMYGLDDVDLLYFSQTKRFVDGTDLDEANALLEEFLNERGHALISDPIKRAVLQRDLWALFDWYTNRMRTREMTRAGYDFQKNLVLVMKGIALTTDEIESLPDNYQKAVDSQAYPAEVDIHSEETAYLPADLFDEENGPWVRIYGRPLEGDAEAHILHTNGRSVFWVFLKLPEGKEQTWEYIELLRNLPKPFEFTIKEKSHKFEADQFVLRDIASLPHFPAGTQAALVEQAILVNSEGDIVVSPLVVDIQIRAYRKIEGNPHNHSQPDTQSQYKLKLHRTELIAGHVGGLVSFDNDATSVPTFRTHGFDPFENGIVEKRERPAQPVLNRCYHCHQGTGVYSFNSRFRLIGHPGKYMSRQGKWRNPPNSMENPAPINERTKKGKAGWKKRQYDWGLLRGIWHYSE